MALESLEARTTLSITWTGAFDDSWADPQNWSAGRLPADGENVIIPDASAHTPVRFASGSANIGVLTCDDPLSIEGGTLTIAGAGSSTVDDALSLSGGSLVLSGAATSFSATSPMTVTGGSIRAQAGAVGTLSATTLSRVNLLAEGGGQLLFPAVTAYTDGDLETYGITASGAGSLIDLGHAATIAGSNPQVYGNKLAVTASQGGRVVMSGAVTGYTVFQLSDSASALDLQHITSLEDCDVIAIGGGSIDFPDATILRRVNLRAGNASPNASSGVLTFPVATTYEDGQLASYSILSIGIGSRIDLSHLIHTTGSQNAPFGDKLEISPSAGGRIDLAGNIDGYVVLSVADTNSILDVSRVIGLGGVDVNISGGAVLTFPAVTAMTRTSLYAGTSDNGGSTGQIFFPLAAMDQFSGDFANDYAIRAIGAGSRIDVSHIGAISGGDGYFFNSLRISASNGGEIDLSGDISGETTLEVDSSSTLNAERVSSLDGITMAPKRSMSFPNVKTIAGSWITADGITITFAQAESLTNVDLVADHGGQTLFPAASTLITTDDAQRGVRSSAGSLIDMSHLKTVGGRDSFIIFSALGGGSIKLAGDIHSGTTLNIDGAGSSIDLSGTPSLEHVDINITHGATFAFSRSIATGMYQVHIVVSGGSQLLFPAGVQIQWATSDSIEIKDAASGLRNDGTLVSQNSGVTITVSPASTFLNNGTMRGGWIVEGDWTNNGDISVGEGWTSLRGLGLNTGTMSVGHGGFLDFYGTGVVNRGQLKADGGALRFSAPLEIDGSGTLEGTTAGSIELNTNLSGDTTAAAASQPGSPLGVSWDMITKKDIFFEAMSRDQGAALPGFTDNFVYQSISIRNQTTLRLTDDHHNSSAAPEAVYVNSISVEKDSVLDLHGLHLYARLAGIEGTVINGSIGVIPDGGPLVVDVPSPGAISQSGETDHWTFHSPAGRIVSIYLNPGDYDYPRDPAAPGPVLDWGSVTVTDPSGHVLKTVQSGMPGSLLSFERLLIPTEGTYQVSVSAATAQPHAIGNYQIVVDDITQEVFAAAPNQLLGASAGLFGGITVAMHNSLGYPAALMQAAGQATWTGSDLQSKTGSPSITGETVTWVDPKDGLTYAAAMTSEGLGLFTNTSGTSWTFRSLSTEIGGIPTITGNLTTFTSTDGIVSIAGVSSSGDLIRYYQTGSGTAGQYAWTAINHGDDLRAQGLSVPRFVGRITSFVTSWNALNVVGLDADGQIQAVWWHQSLKTDGKWTTNNLSALTGAPALNGGLTVWLTGWDAINIAGADAHGNLSTTWWVAASGGGDQQWRTMDMTAFISGPQLQAGSITSWVTPWNAMNIVGREADGTISAYRWVPSASGGDELWHVAKLTDASATATTGPITAITARGGDFSMNILSTSASGDVIREWWSPSTNTWAEQNMTQLAIPA